MFYSANHGQSGHGTLLQRPWSAELLESWKKVDNQVTSLRAVGLAVDAEASKEAAAACDAAQRLLDDLFPAVLATLSSPVEGVPMTILPFLTAYVNKLKRTSTLPQVEIKSCPCHEKLPPPSPVPASQAHVSPTSQWRAFHDHPAPPCGL